MDLRATVSLKGAIFEGKAPAIIKEELTDAMYEATSLLEAKVKAIVEREAVGVYGAQGGLLSTIHGEVEGKGTPMIKGIVAHGSEHGDVIEKGRRAGKTWPPEGSLMRWIEVKNIVPEGKDNIWSKEVSSVGEAVGITRARKQLEFLIRRKIGKKGFPGVHMFERAFKENLPKVVEIFDRRGFVITQRLSGK